MNEEQFKRNYKKAVDHMKTNEQMKKRVEQSLNTQHQGPKRQRKPLYIAASVVIGASIGLICAKCMATIQWTSGTNTTGGRGYPGRIIQPDCDSEDGVAGFKRQRCHGKYAATGCL